MPRRRLIALAVLGCAVLPAAGAGAAQTTTRRYVCTWPLFGTKDLTATSTLDDAAAWHVGEPAPAILSVTARPHDMVAAFKVIRGAVAIRGTMTSGLAIDSAISKPVQAFVEHAFGPLPISPAPLPGEPYVFASTGPQPPVRWPGEPVPGEAPVPITVSDVGPHRIALQGDLTLHVQFLDASGAPIALSSAGGAHDPTVFDVPCRVDPATQELGLGEAPVLAPPTPTPVPTPNLRPTPQPTPPGGPATTARFAYALEGSTTIPTLSRSALPLRGQIDLELAVATGDYTATTVIDDTQGRQTSLGFLPVTVTIGIVPSGPTTGRLEDDHLTAYLDARIKVKRVKAFGVVPLAAGNGCQTKELSLIGMASTDSFDPTLGGGSLGGSYPISDLNGCDVLGGYVSPLTAHAGNTITAKLTPVGGG